MRYIRPSLSYIIPKLSIYLFGAIGKNEKEGSPRLKVKFGHEGQGIQTQQSQLYVRLSSLPSITVLKKQHILSDNNEENINLWTNDGRTVSVIEQQL